MRIVQPRHFLPRTGIPRGITHSCFRWMEPGKGGDNRKQLTQCTAGWICDEVQHQHPCFILTPQSPTSLKRVEMLYIENHRVYGLDPADPIRVSYGTPLGEELIARERPDLVRMPVDSQSLLPVLLGAPRAEARRELVLQRMGHLALSQGGWRYIPANRPPGTKRSTVAKGAETVLAKTHRYRLAADPGGNHNLHASDREQVAALAEAVAADGMMAKR